MIADPDVTTWTASPTHRAWLSDQACRLLAFFAPSIDPRGGFHELDNDGRPIPLAPGRGRQLHSTARLVHGYAVGHLLGHPGSDAIVDHGMAYLWARHRDALRGGYLWEVAPDGTSDGVKQAYGHAFVLLAAASAKAVGHPHADRLLTDILDILDRHFWDDRHGVVADEFDRELRPLSTYRGQNANMHLVEALMAAFEVTGDPQCLDKAERIADLLIRRRAVRYGWRVPEHFDKSWAVDATYSGDPMFRPAGTTPGHGLEWARLLLQLWQLGGRGDAWMRAAAPNLFRQATADGWMAEGGFRYTVGTDGAPLRESRYWWPCCEGIGAAAFLNAIDGDAIYEDWYRRLWIFSAGHFIDHARGGWYPEIDADSRPTSGTFQGKPDLYHALQACLIPLLPATGSVIQGLRNADLAGPSTSGATTGVGRPSN